MEELAWGSGVQWEHSGVRHSPKSTGFGQGAAEGLGKEPGKGLGEEPGVSEGVRMPIE